MNTRRHVAFVLGLFAVAGAGGVLAIRKVDAAPPAEPMHEAAEGAVPVLVELFTSEGCSSCPPADVVLARLERSQSVQNARVVPIALHVDYWDSLGWPDPFASSAWTDRQRTYGGNYTPQAVIDGSAQMVGSREGAVALAIAEAAKKPHATLVLAIAPKDGGFIIDTKISALPAAQDAELVVALTQKFARVVVERGENGGKTLDHTAIARELRIVGTVAPGGGALRTVVKAPSGIAARDLRVVAFVAERKSHRVLGTATSDLTAP